MQGYFYYNGFYGLSFMLVHYWISIYIIKTPDYSTNTFNSPEYPKLIYVQILTLDQMVKASMTTEPHVWNCFNTSSMRCFWWKYRDRGIWYACTSIWEYICLSRFYHDDRGLQTNSLPGLFSRTDHRAWDENTTRFPEAIQAAPINRGGFMLLEPIILRTISLVVNYASTS